MHSVVLLMLIVHVEISDIDDNTDSANEPLIPENKSVETENTLRWALKIFFMYTKRNFCMSFLQQ